MIKSVRSFFALCILAAGQVLSQSLPPKASVLSGEFLVDNWTADQGLPQSSIQAITQTPDGYLWLASQAGVIRFDGRTFKTFTRENTPELQHDWINTLTVSRDGTLWLGVYASSLVSYKDNVFKAFTPRDGIPDDIVVAICATESTEVWAGTKSSGIAIHRNGSFTIIDTTDGLPSNSILTIFKDRSGTMWVGTPKGLAAQTAAGWRVFRMRDGLPDDYVQSIQEDDEGSLYVGTQRGLCRMQSGRFVAIAAAPIPRMGITAITPSEGGTAWLGTYTGGLLRLNKDRVGSVSLIPGEAPTIFSIFEDRESNIWIGTDGFGLFRIRRARVTALTPANRLSSGAVWTICETQGNEIWVGTDGNGIDRLSGSRRTNLTVKDGLPGNVVFSLQSTPDGTVWIGTERGLARYRKGRIDAFTPKNGYPFPRVGVMHADHHGNIWVVAAGVSIGTYDGKWWTYYTTKNGLSSDFGTCLLVDRHETVWVGNQSRGITSLRDGQVVHHTTETGLSNNVVSCVFEDSSGGIWVGTYGGGLSRFDQGRWTTVSTRHGLPEDIIYAAERDHLGMRWLSGNKGIFRVAEQDLIACANGQIETLQGVLIDKTDGMPSSECCGGVQPASLKTRNGHLWFPTVRGIAVINPGEFQVNEIAPPVVVQGLRAERVDIPLKDQIELAAGVRDVEIIYAGLSFVAPERVQYRYRLDGYDRDWIDAGNRREAYYTGLVPGDYVFRVQAANEDGVWNTAGVVLPIMLNAMWYQTWWFYTLIVVVVVSGSYGTYRMRVQQLLKHEKELERRVDEALANMKVLGGLIPICANCKKIRDDKGYWNNLERYIHDHSEAKFSHSLCPDCMEKLYGNYLKKDEATGKFVSARKKN